MVPWFGLGVAFTINKTFTTQKQGIYGWKKRGVLHVKSHQHILPNSRSRHNRTTGTNKVGRSSRQVSSNGDASLITPSQQQACSKIMMTPFSLPRPPQMSLQGQAQERRHHRPEQHLRWHQPLHQKHQGHASGIAPQASAGCPSCQDLNRREVNQNHLSYSIVMELTSRNYIYDFSNSQVLYRFWNKKKHIYSVIDFEFNRYPWVNPWVKRNVPSWLIMDGSRSCSSVQIRKILT